MAWSCRALWSSIYVSLSWFAIDTDGAHSQMTKSDNNGNSHGVLRAIFDVFLRTGLVRKAEGRDGSCVQAIHHGPTERRVSAWVAANVYQGVHAGGGGGPRSTEQLCLHQKDDVKLNILIRDVFSYDDLQS